MIPLGLVEKEINGCHNCRGHCTQARDRRSKELLFMQNIVEYWRFAITRSGRFALLPCSVKPGDVVAVVIGMSTPLVLRKTNTDPSSAMSTYLVAGRCYVEDIMDGEAVSDLKMLLEGCKTEGMKGHDLEKRLGESAQLWRIVLE